MSGSCEGEFSEGVCYMLARGQSHVVPSRQAYPSQREGTGGRLLPILQSNLPGISHTFKMKAKIREKHNQRRPNLSNRKLRSYNFKVEARTRGNRNDERKETSNVPGGCMSIASLKEQTVRNNLLGTW